MKVLNVNRNLPDLLPDFERQVKQALQDKQVIVYPTDTLYGLGADACSDVAVAELYRLKVRDKSPVSVLLESTSQLLDMVTDLSDQGKQIIRKFLPGPLTVVCRTPYSFARQLISEKGTIGFRVPGDLISRRIVTIFGHPITTTSVNPAGEIPASTREEVIRYYEGQVSLMINVGPLERSKGSTVLDLSVTPFKILREGEISRHRLLKYLN